MRWGRSERPQDAAGNAMTGHWRLECTHWAPPNWFTQPQVRHMTLVFCQKCGDVRRVAARAPWPA
jgi:hypothetical protein